ncbi:MAG: hypothetical protein HKN82_07180 [Akkermansiaceae bacterium]|nr:hypothetical protein [Akkermansiaceae bacterium]
MLETPGRAAKPEIQPLIISVGPGAVVAVNTGPAREVLTLAQLARRLDMYTTAARAVAAAPVVRLRTARAANEDILREVLARAAIYKIPTIQFEIRKDDALQPPAELPPKVRPHPPARKPRARVIESTDKLPEGPPRVIPKRPAKP